MQHVSMAFVPSHPKLIEELEQRGASARKGGFGLRDSSATQQHGHDAGRASLRPTNFENKLGAAFKTSRKVGKQERDRIGVHLDFPDGSGRLLGAEHS